MYHKLMNGGMGMGWTPEQIGKLTPGQVMCLAVKSPPLLGAMEPADAIEEAKRVDEAWRM